PDGRLHRPRSLSRAVRESLPAQLPRALPRIGARHRVVARQPARTPGGLPPGLRRPLSERHPALLALPARRARVLDLLLDVPAGGIAFAPRQRRVDQEGALSATARRVLGRRAPARPLPAHLPGPD